MDSWLANRQWWRPGLKRELNTAFEAEHRAARSRSATWITLLGAVISLAFTPLLLSQMQDIAGVVLLTWLGITQPLALICALLLSRNPHPAMREMLAAVPGIAIAASLTTMFALSGKPGTEMYVAAINLVMLYAAIALQLRFSTALVTLGAIVALYGWGVSVSAAVAPGDGVPMFGLCAMSGAYILLATWRMNAAQGYSFVLALREQLRQETLRTELRTLDALAHRDALTGVANRRGYDSWLAAAWQNAHDVGAPVGLIMVDVDHFKAYNDSYGHPAGDACLAAIGGSLNEQLRGTFDLVARIGGEEFGVLLPGLDAPRCAAIAERLRAAIEALELPHPTRGFVSISCGAASLPADTDPAALTEAADKALYAAKASGRNCVCIAERAPIICTTNTPEFVSPGLAAAADPVP